VIYGTRVKLSGGNEVEHNEVSLFYSNDLYTTINVLALFSYPIKTGGLRYFHSASIYNDKVVLQYTLSSNTQFPTYVYSLTNDLIKSFVSLGFVSYEEDVDPRFALKDMQNIYNNVNIYVAKPNYLVEKAEVYAIDVNSGSAYLVKSIDNDDISPEGTTILFKNDLIYRLLSPTEKNVLFSNVPLKAQHQAFVGGRLWYFNYTDGRNLPKPNFNVSADYSTMESYTFQSNIGIPNNRFTVNFTSGGNPLSVKSGQSLLFDFTYQSEGNILTRIVFQHIFKQDYSNITDASLEIQETLSALLSGCSIVNQSPSLLFIIPSDTSLITVSSLYIKDKPLTYKKGGSEKIGITYYDKYNRGSFPIFDESDISIKRDITKPKVSISAVIKHTPPEWAVKYKFVRADRNLFYEIMYGFQYAKYLNGSIYLMKYDQDSYSPEPGMALEFFLPDGNGYLVVVENKVTKEADFVEGSPMGDWIVIADTNIQGFMGSDVVAGTDLFSSTVFYAVTNTALESNILFYEIPGVYEISGGYHQGNVQNQDSTHDAIVTIKNDGNVIYLDSVGVEINKISKTGYFLNGGRPCIEIENVGEVHRKAEMCFSDTFVQDTGVNGLALFNLGIGNFKKLDIADGAITAILPIESNLTIWQEDEVGQMLVDKDAITTSTGSKAVTASDIVAGEFMPYGGEYGTLHPESIAFFGGAKYFVDARRNTVCRLSQDGISEINYFYENAINSIIKEDGVYYGAYNPENKEYWLYDKDNLTVHVYDEKINKWSRVITPITISKIVNDSKNIHTFFEDKIYIHGVSEDYGTIHDEPLTLELEYVANESPSEPKVYNAIELESNIPMSVSVESKGVVASIATTDFENREDEFFAYIPNSGDIDDVMLDLETGMITPMGEAAGNVGGVVTTKLPIQTMQTLNHRLYYVNAGIAILVGSITSISDNIITTDNIAIPNDNLKDKFVFAKEKSYLNGRNIRGNVLKVKLSDSTTDELELYAVNINTTKVNN
jgi:hypothetical protein